MAFTDDIGTRLQSQSCGTMGTNLFVGPRESPDECVWIRETVGRGYDRTMRGRTAANPVVHLTARSTTRAAARTLIDKCVTALDNFSGTLNGVRYLWICAQHDPVDIGEDENKRYQYTCSFLCKKEPTP